MKAYFGEFLGTAALVFVGCGSVAFHQETYPIQQLGIAIAFGAIVTLMIFSFRKWSGTHINPAVTLAFLTLGKISIPKSIGYIVAQCLGALTGAFLIRMVYPSNEFLGASLPSGSVTESFIWEYVLTFLLMMVILISVITERSDKYVAPWTIGFTVFLEALLLGPICGASMNPARSLGPALMSGHVEHLWLYLVATTLGALTIAAIWRLARR